MTTKACERRRFEVSPTVRLHGAEQRVRSFAKAVANRAQHRIARRREVVPYLSYSDECGQGVADDRQLEILEPAV
jgi:hypothetical protein